MCDLGQCTAEEELYKLINTKHKHAESSLFSTNSECELVNCAYSYT